MTYIPYIDPDHYGNFFQIDDVSTPIDPAAEHFVISGYGTYGAPERDVEMVAIPGRNGDLIFDNGRFTNAEVYYDIGWARGFGGDFDYVVSATDLFDWDAVYGSSGLGIAVVINKTAQRITLAGECTEAATFVGYTAHFDRGTYKFVSGATGAANASFWAAVEGVDNGEQIHILDLTNGATEAYFSVPTSGNYVMFFVVREGENFGGSTLVLSPKIYASTVRANQYSGFDYFRGQLMSKSDTYYKLTDSYHPGEYRMARVARIEEISTTALNDGGRCRVVFDCKPQRYLATGEEKRSLTNETAATVELYSYYASYPVITVQPLAGSRIHGITVEITANGETMSVTVERNGGIFPSAAGAIVIDCGTKSASFTDSLPIITAATTEFPHFEPGTENTIKVTLTPQSGQTNVNANITYETREYVV